MSDAYVSGSATPDTSMKGLARLIVVLGDIQIVKDSARKLNALGGLMRVARGVFLIHGHVPKIHPVLNDLPAISFLKVREIPSVNDRGEEATSRRVYSIVSYRFKSPTSAQKKRVERLVRKSISIRLRPGVLLFPVLRSKDRRSLLESDEANKLLDSRRLSEELRNLGADVSRWSRLRLVEHHSKLEEAVVRTHSHEIMSFENLVKDLRNQAKDPEEQAITLKKRYSILSRRHRELKVKWDLANKIWGYDATKSLTRSYNMMIAARRSIDSLS